MPEFTTPIPATGRNIDLHLLRCFDALVTACSVTLAADRLGMSQPGMSNALSRLRKIFGDPILHRTARGMAPTERALAVWPDVQQALQHLGRLVAQPGRFDPGRARGLVRVASVDAAICAALAPVIGSILEEAPGLEIQLQQLSHVRVQEPLETGAVDLAFGFYPDLPATLYSRRVLTSPVCCMVGRNGPYARGITLREYTRAAHVRLHMNADFKSTFESRLEQRLAKLKLARRVAISAPSTAIMASLVGSSPLVGTVPALVADYQSLAYPVAAVPAPIALPAVPFSLVWHARSLQSSAVAWVREKLVQGIAAFQAQRPGVRGRMPAPEEPANLQHRRAGPRG